MALTEKKTREWWTIYEKWAVVEALLGSGMSITEYCRDRAQYGQNLDWQRVGEWKNQYDKEDWNGWLDACSAKEKQEVKKVPNWWRVLMNARAVAEGRDTPFNILGRKKFVDKWDYIRELADELNGILKERLALRENVKWTQYQGTLQKMTS